MIQKKTLIAGVVVALAVGVGGVSVASGAGSGAGGVNDAGKAKQEAAPLSVPATPAGMPPTAQVLYAVVNGNGTLARGFGATSVVREGAGIYRVGFRQNISGCAFNGTIGLGGNLGVEQSGEIQVVTANVNPAQVFVTTRTSAGAFADRGFHLSVAC